jgi:tetratricopeptide (TPR) repeat protein
LNAAGPEAARAAFLQALAISPNYGPALFNLGVLHRDHLGDAAEARRCFQLYLAGLTDEPYASQARQALASPPAPPPSTPTPKPAGTALPTPKPPATASSAATPPARATAPFDPVVSAALNTARAAIQKGILDDALVTLQRAAVQRPDNPDLAWEIARLYHRHLNDPQHTALLYDEFVQRFPADPRAAEARAERAKLPPSVDSLPTPTRRTADRRKATEAYNAGVAAHQGGKLTKAIELYRQALESDPGMTDAYYNLGLAYQASSDLVRAKAAFRQALEYEPAMLNARYMLGLVYRDLNEDRDAIAALEAVLKANPNHADAHLALAYVYRKAPSQSALARQHFERYLALEPNGESAASVRQWLQSGR